MYAGAYGTMFQFYLSSIKRCSHFILVDFSISFNSTLVQLKDNEWNAEQAAINRFQFYLSSIKSYRN